MEGERGDKAKELEQSVQEVASATGRLPKLKSILSLLQEGTGMKVTVLWPLPNRKVMGRGKQGAFYSQMAPLAYAAFYSTSGQEIGPCVDCPSIQFGNEQAGKTI